MRTQQPWVAQLSCDLRRAHATGARIIHNRHVSTGAARTRLDMLLGASSEGEAAAGLSWQAWKESAQPTICSSMRIAVAVHVRPSSSSKDSMQEPDLIQAHNHGLTRGCARVEPRPLKAWNAR